MPNVIGSANFQRTYPIRSGAITTIYNCRGGLPKLSFVVGRRGNRQQVTARLARVSHAHTATSIPIPLKQSAPFAPRMSQLDKLYGRMDDDLERPAGPSEESEIAKCLSGKTLFITGGTGYMGKIFVEKVLRSCQVKHIYLLMRLRNNMTIDEVLSKYFQNIVFDGLRKSSPDFTKKVTAVSGALDQDKLGLSEANYQVLVNQVDMMFHNAANVKFDAPVSLALKVNVLGTKHILELANECKKLELFLYNSTAYSHCYRKDIYEECYASPASIDQVHDIISQDLAKEKGFSEEELQELIGKFPNIYTYSKAIAEGLVNEQSKTAHYKCVIYRPSVVLSCYKDPLPGWCGNHNGPVLIMVAAGVGMLHVIFHHNYPLDMIPCDMAINSILAITWDATTNRKEKLSIYNYGSSTINPISLPEMHTSLKKRFLTTDLSKKTIWMPFLILTDSKLLFWLAHIFFHLVPAALLDLFLIIRGQKPRAVSMWLFGTKHLDKIDYFGNGNWRIHVNQTYKAIDRMNSKDKELFYCDLRPEAFDWYVYMVVMWQGIRKYILKEEIDLKGNYRTYIRVTILHYGLIAIILLSNFYWLSRLFL